MRNGASVCVALYDVKIAERYMQYSTVQYSTVLV